MIYYRRYIEDYLSTPFVTSFCLLIEEDFDAFFSKYFDSSNIRVSKSGVRKALRTVLKDMVQDGLLIEDKQCMRLGPGNHSRYISVYKLKMKDFTCVDQIANEKLSGAVYFNHIMSSIK